MANLNTVGRFAMGTLYHIGEGQVSVHEDMLRRLLLLVKKCDRCDKAFEDKSRYFDHDSPEVLCFGCWY